MKLNVRRTVLIGFAFLSICAFWELYDNLVPLILSNTFKVDKTFSGIIMAADNVLALFLLPLFGGFSDRCRSPLGRRKPFIAVGTIAAVMLMNLLPILDNSYFAKPTQLKATLFIVILGLLLITMGTYRSPAVALMPDVTPKPLRSKGNAIINLMGAVGGIIYLIMVTFLYSEEKTKGLVHIDYTTAFLIVADIMLLALLILLLFVDEPKLAAKQKAYEDAHPEQQVVAEKGDKVKLPKEVRRSLIFLLLSVAFWYIGYNAVKTWFSTYATSVWDMSPGAAAFCLTVATAGAIISYIPVGILASKIGRRKTIIGGVVLLGGSFLLAYIYTLFASSFSPILYVLFVAIGIAWAAINVNSFPMVVEMCSGSDVGKFTGLYYTFSMIAQIITPVLSGYLYDHVSGKILFLYAAVFSGAALLTMLMVHHGDNKIEAKSGLEAFDVED